MLDLYLKAKLVKLVLFVDSFDCACVDLGKCLDLTVTFLKDGSASVIDQVSKMETGWLYLQRGIVDESLIKQVAYFCDGYVDYKKEKGNTESTVKWWFKTSSTKVVHSPTNSITNSKNSKGEELELLEERHALEKDKVELHFGSGQAAAAGFDSDDPDADLDI